MVALAPLTPLCWALSPAAWRSAGLGAAQAPPPTAPLLTGTNGTEAEAAQASSSNNNSSTADNEELAMDISLSDIDGSPELPLPPTSTHGETHGRLTTQIFFQTADV